MASSTMRGGVKQSPSIGESCNQPFTPEPSTSTSPEKAAEFTVYQSGSVAIKVFESSEQLFQTIKRSIDVARGAPHMIFDLNHISHPEPDSFGPVFHLLGSSRVSLVVHTATRHTLEQNGLLAAIRRKPGAELSLCDSIAELSLGAPDPLKSAALGQAFIAATKAEISPHDPFADIRPPQPPHSPLQIEQHTIDGVTILKILANPSEQFVSDLIRLVKELPTGPCVVDLSLVNGDLKVMANLLLQACAARKKSGCAPLEVRAPAAIKATAFKESLGPQLGFTLVA